MDEDRRELRVWCPACQGDGTVPHPELALLGEVPQTVLVERTCQWCDGTGRRRFAPPV